MYSKFNIFCVIVLITIVSSSCSDSNNTNIDSEDDVIISIQNISSNESPESDVVEQKVIILNEINYDLCSVFNNNQLANLDNNDLSFLRNAVYAKHGYSFSNEKYRKFFNNYEWYIEKDKNVKSEFDSLDSNNVNLILEFEKINNLTFKNIPKNIMDYDNTLISNSIEISITKLEDHNNTNFPKQVVLKTDNSEYIFKSSWNDGLRVQQLDFDVTDEYRDVCITEFSTDVSYVTYIYRYNNNEIFEYIKFIHYNRDLFYDQNGFIYFSSNPSDPVTTDSILNYKLNHVEVISKQLKYKLDLLK